MSSPPSFELALRQKDGPEGGESSASSATSQNVQPIPILTVSSPEGVTEPLSQPQETVVPLGTSTDVFHSAEAPHHPLSETEPFSASCERGGQDFRSEPSHITTNKFLGVDRNFPGRFTNQSSSSTREATNTGFHSQPYPLTFNEFRGNNNLPAHLATQLFSSSGEASNPAIQSQPSLVTFKEFLEDESNLPVHLAHRPSNSAPEEAQNILTIRPDGTYLLRPLGDQGSHHSTTTEPHAPSSEEAQTVLTIGRDGKYHLEPVENQQTSSPAPLTNQPSAPSREEGQTILTIGRDGKYRLSPLGDHQGSSPSHDPLTTISPFPALEQSDSQETLRVAPPPTIGTGRRNRNRSRNATIRPAQHIPAPFLPRPRRSSSDETIKAGRTTTLIGVMPSSGESTAEAEAEGKGKEKAVEEEEEKVKEEEEKKAAEEEEEDPAGEWEVQSRGSLTETEPFPELPDVDLQLALLAAYNVT